MTYTTNGGLTWSVPTISAKAFPFGGGEATSAGLQYFQTIAVDASGRVSIAYYHTSSWKAHNVLTYLSETTDNGNNWTFRKIGANSFDPAQAVSSIVYHYLGLATAGSSSYLVWTDHRNGNADVYWATTDPAPRQPHDVSISATPPNQYGYRYPQLTWARNEDFMDYFYLYRRSKEAGVWSSWQYLNQVSNPNLPATTVEFTDWSISTAGSGEDSVQYRIIAHRSYFDADYYSTPAVVSIRFATYIWKVGGEGSTDNPVILDLLQNAPNPFNPSTRIVYSLPSDGVVTIKVFDVLGRFVLTALDDFRAMGEHDLTFDAGTLPSGSISIG